MTKKIKHILASISFVVIATMAVFGYSSLNAQSEGDGGGGGCPSCPDPVLICAQATGVGYCVADPAMTCRIANTYGDIYCPNKRRGW